jgi:hypothetical protein
MDGRRVDAGPDAADVVGVEVAGAVGTVAGGGHGAAATLGRGAATTTAAGRVGATVVLDDGGRDDGGAAAPLGVAWGTLGGFGRRRGVVQRSQASWRWREK